MYFVGQPKVMDVFGFNNKIKEPREISDKECEEERQKGNWSF